MININQIMTNMNQMNQLINSMNGVQPNNNLNNINFMMNDIININKPNYNTHIIFKRLLNLEKYTINCNTSDKIKDVIQQYRIKSGDTRSDKFIHNNRILNFEKTIAENSITNGGIVECLEPYLVG